MGVPHFSPLLREVGIRGPDFPWPTLFEFFDKGVRLPKDEITRAEPPIPL
jgi:hypothetical protein